MVCEPIEMAIGGIPLMCTEKISTPLLLKLQEGVRTEPFLIKRRPAFSFGEVSFQKPTLSIAAHFSEGVNAQKLKLQPSAEYVSFQDELIEPHTNMTLLK